MNVRNCSLSILAVALLTRYTAAQEFLNDFQIGFHGAGWFQGGRTMHISDTITGGENFVDNWMINAGALFNIDLIFDDELDASMGIGAIKAHNPRGQVSGTINLNFYLASFVNMARFTYTRGGDKATSPLQLTVGLFDYKYDYNIRNLGLYLIRGSVYPGIIISSFESKEMLPSGNMLGAHMRNHIGSYTQDLLVVSETDLGPKFDFSIIYVGTYNFPKLLELGAGINFYHFLPVRPDLTTPTEEHFDPRESEDNTYDHEFDRKYALDLDTMINGTDTTYTREWYSNKGVKVMGRLVLDPKELMSTEIFGPNDLKLYAEAAILGVKNYQKIYNNIIERIPVMVGFGIPTFKLLDDCALEIEYYGSKYLPDYSKVVRAASPIPQNPHKGRVKAQPGEEQTPPYDVDADNWKWSLYLAKVLGGHMKISGQVASDHYRISSEAPWFPTYEETFSTWKDWYWMAKLTFFF